MDEMWELEVIARSYFQHLFSAGRRGNYDHILSRVDHCILDEENSKLKASYTKEEIRETLAELGPTKALGEDGFPTLFYQKCWTIIGEDVTSFCLNILNGGMDITYEILHTLKHKKVGKRGLMTVKLDMSKAYDRVEWNFVKIIMKKMRFDSEWVDSLIKCVTTVSYSVVFNGHIVETFIPSRGLRQGDPLSPFLFLFCGEGLFSLMRLAMKGRTIRGVKASKSGPQVSHLLFVDDCILFEEATERGTNSLKQILHEYEIYSGQSVNYTKSIIFFSTNTQEGERRTTINLLGVRSSNDLERYLGLPNMVGRRKKSSFQGLKDRLKQQIDNWSIKHLSQ
ncbi:reverse transcriptase [Gossypium australe]|uniref:Reverse transcriptase n=1 Tax=Gossypium australe TaxID=47621 RepID=A0A5B6VV77_9ROSI|nr:reverse transcriptase [Gossypium australe]